MQFDKTHRKIKTMARNFSLVAEMVYSLLQRQETLGTGMGKKLTLNSSLMEELSQTLATLNSRHILSSDIEVLQQLCQAVKVLQILGSNVNLAHECLDVSYFVNISVLKLKNVCVEQLKGLSRLRAYLKILVYQSGLSNLESLFVHCGADHCSDCFLWSELTEAIFTHHEHLYLGEAFKLTPWLKYLDLSKNHLSSQEIHSLAYLSHLTQLNISFNRLVRVPYLAPSASNNLQILLLRHNQLDSLKGLETLIGLQELDASYNCLATTESISFIGNLPKLRRLYLERNPIASHSLYRLLVSRHLSPCVPKEKFGLDAKPLLRSELNQLGINCRTIPLITRVLSIQTVPPLPPPPLLSVPSPIPPPSPSPIEVLSSTSSLQPPLSPKLDKHDESLSKLQSPVFRTVEIPSPTRISPISEGCKTSDSVSISSRRLKTSSSIKKRRIRVRVAEIADVNDEETDSLLSVTLPDLSMSSLRDGTKQKLEALVATFGPGDWLHSQGARELRQLLGWSNKIGANESAAEEEKAILAEEINLLKSLELELLKIGPGSAPPPAISPPPEGLEAPEQKFDDDVIVLERENVIVEDRETREESVVVLTVEKQGRDREEDRESDIEVVTDKERGSKPSFVVGSADDFSQSVSGNRLVSLTSAKTESVSTQSIKSCTKSTLSSADSGLASIVYSYVDFSQVDHRLKLYCEMSLMTGRGEEFLGVLKAGLVDLNDVNPEEQVLLVLTSHRVYFMKIIGPESEVVEKWLQKMTSYVLSALKSVLITYRNQTVGLQFKDETYLLILRDERRTKNFIQFLQDAFERSGYRLQTVDMSQLVTPVLVLSLTEGELKEECHELEFVLLLAFHYSAAGGSVTKQGKLDVAVVCDKEQLFLIQSDVRWLLSVECQLLKVCQNSIANLVTVASSAGRGGKLRFYFMDEVSRSDEEWILTFATSEAARRFVEAIREPWEAVFSVDMQITEEDF